MAEQRHRQGLVVDHDRTVTFPTRAPLEPAQRGEYITEQQCVALCANFQAKQGAALKADVFRLAYLTGIRRGQLRNAHKRHVLIVGDTWKLRAV